MWVRGKGAAGTGMGAGGGRGQGEVVGALEEAGVNDRRTTRAHTRGEGRAPSRLVCDEGK